MGSGAPVEGQRVEARTSEGFRGGTVERDNGDGTFAVRFDDGGHEAVVADDIRDVDLGLPAHMRGWEASVKPELRAGVAKQLVTWQKFALRVALSTPSLHANSLLLVAHAQIVSHVCLRLSVRPRRRLRSHARSCRRVVAWWSRV